MQVENSKYSRCNKFPALNDSELQKKRKIRTIYDLIGEVLYRLTSRELPHRETTTLQQHARAYNMSFIDSFPHHCRDADNSGGGPSDAIKEFPIEY